MNTSTQVIRQRSWWPEQWLLGWLNVTLTAPIIYLYVGLPLVMRQHDWSGTQIGLLQLAGLPAMLKFLLAAPLERHPLGRASYRNWAVLLGLGYIAALLALGAHDVADTSHGRLFALAVLVNLMGTWADVPVNALAIRMLPESERFRAGAMRSAATSLGAIVGGGMMLLMYARLGWAWPFRTLSLCLLSGLLLMLLWRRHVPRQATLTQTQDTALSRAAPAETQNTSARRAGTAAGWRCWPGYFHVPQHRFWSVLLLLYFPFVGAAWVYLKPLLLDHGFAPEGIAAIVGMGGGVAGALGSLVAGRLTRALGARLTLPLFSAGALLAMLWLAMAAAMNLGYAAFIVAVAAIALSMGATSALVFGLMMYHARPGLQALDYGIQSSLFIVARTTVPVLAGVMLDYSGYVGVLLGLTSGTALALVLAWNWRNRICLRAA